MIVGSTMMRPVNKPETQVSIEISRTSMKAGAGEAPNDITPAAPPANRYKATAGTFTSTTGMVTRMPLQREASLPTGIGLDSAIDRQMAKLKAYHRRAEGNYNTGNWPPPLAGQK